MHFSNAALLALSSSLVAAQGKTHMVKVGDGDLVFQPSSLTANVGDKVMFMFWPESHSVVQGSFDEPCWPASQQAFFSGPVPVKEGMSPTTFTIDIKNKDPIWLYCATEGHCQAGMVGVINPEQGGSTLQQYMQGAMKSKDTRAPSKVQGGQLTKTGGTMTMGNGTSPSNTPDAAGNLAAHGGMVGAVAGAIAWALL